MVKSISVRNTFEQPNQARNCISRQIEKRHYIYLTMLNNEKNQIQNKSNMNESLAIRI